jgi:3D (Asp-Asp-Asp) domain-containing protein
MMVTAYWPDPSWSNGITATGMRAKKGIIAVDPTVIPFGTHLYVPGYGQGIAEDTGGAIRGDHIDVCFDDGTQAVDWGVQYLTVDIERANN